MQPFDRGSTDGGNSNQNVLNYMKCASCKDMGVDCPWTGKAETIDELAVKVKEHAMSDHKEWWAETGSKMSEEEVKKMTTDVAKDC